MRRRLLEAGGVALAGLALWGPVGILLAAPGALVLARIRAARAERRAREALDGQAIEFVASLGAEIRAGRSLAQALVDVHAEVGAPLRDRLDPAVRALASGDPAGRVIGLAASALPSHASALVRVALRVGRASGGDAGGLLARAAETLRERRRLAAERAAATAQARTSAVVIGTLPLAFLALAGPRAGLLGMLGRAEGWLLLGAGLALEGAGLWWVRRVIAS